VILVRALFPIVEEVRRADPQFAIERTSIAYTT